MNYFFYKDENIRVEHKYDFPMSQEQCFWHTHHNAELYYFLCGAAKVHVDESVYSVDDGDVFLLRPNEPHYFEILPDSPYERIVINFNPSVFSEFDKKQHILNCFFEREIGQNNKYRSTDFVNNEYSSYFLNMAKDTDNNEINIFSNLFMILTQIASIFNSKIQMAEPSISSMDSDIIRFVNDYLEKPLSVDLICRKFFVSRSKLTQIFKKNTGMSPWEYVTIKRLNKAHELIDNGHLATKAYELCGFDNYSTFYRAYIKYYGKPPSSSKNYKHSKDD